MTAADLRRDGIGALPCRTPVTSRDGSPMQAPDRHALAESIVRYVGDGVAVVVARSADIARDAAELIEVDYEELEARTGTRLKSSTKEMMKNSRRRRQQGPFGPAASLQLHLPEKEETQG